MEKQLYFAYGSNLNLEDFHKWCESKGFEKNLLRHQGMAYLPDHDVGFTYRSRSRNCGVLDVVPRVGQLVPGVLFEVVGNGWEALNKKEGAPLVYERIKVTLLDEQGNECTAWTYRVLPEKKQDFVPPTDDYLAIVRQGLESWDLPDQLLDAASSNKRSTIPDAFFFYGTLLRRESRFHLLRPFGVECILLAQTFGRLVDLGSYPGLVDLNTQDSMVHGEFVRLQNAEEAIKTLDAVECFRGFGEDGSLYRRTYITVDVGDGRLRKAWVYQLADPNTQAPPIVSGDWRKHQGCHGQFIKRLTEVHANGNARSIAARLACDLPFVIGSDGEKTMESLLPLEKALNEGVISERRLAQASRNWVAIPE